jgi:preprotein translocase subunit YajC
MAGRITKVGDDFVSVEIAEKVEIQIQKPSIAVVLPKGTLKNL